MKLKPSVLAVGLVNLAAVGFVFEANAQALPQPQTPAPQALAKRPGQSIVRVRNFHPSIMAWLLDPAHQTKPVQLRVSGQNLENSFVTFPEPKGMWSKTLALPEGVKQIIPVDPQNILLVMGSEEGIKQVTENVAEYDKPLRQVEIEAQFVEISPEDVAALGMGKESTPVASLPAPNGRKQFAFSSLTARPDVAGQLKQLIQQGKAKLLTAPRMLAIDELTASIGTLRGNTKRTDLEEIHDIAVSDGFQFTAMPSIREDGTTDLAFSVAKTLQLSHEDSTGVFPLQALDVMSGNLNFEDESTIILTAPEGRLASLIENVGGQKKSNVIMLLKTSIVRRR